MKMYKVTSNKADILDKEAENISDSQLIILLFMLFLG